MTNDIKLVSDVETIYKGRTKNYNRKFSNRLWPFLVENLKTRDQVILSETSVREILNTTIEAIKFPSLYVQMLKMFKGKEIMCGKAKHRDGSNLFVFRYREIIDKEGAN